MSTRADSHSSGEYCLLIASYALQYIRPLIVLRTLSHTWSLFFSSTFFITRLTLSTFRVGSGRRGWTTSLLDLRLNQAHTCKTLGVVTKPMSILLARTRRCIRVILSTREARAQYILTTTPIAFKALGVVTSMKLRARVHVT